MRITSFRTITGPNVYHHRGVVIMNVELEEWTEVASNEIPSFNENLNKILPNLKKHTCSPGYEGGFLERLKTGTYMGHIIEHIALELSELAGIGVSFGKTRYAGRLGYYEIATRFKSEAGMKACLKFAVEIAQAAATNKNFDVSSAVHFIKEQVASEKLGPSAQALMSAAEAKGIPVRRLGDSSLLQLGYGKNRRRLQTAVSDGTSLISADIAQDKDLTKQILKEQFLPVPEGLVVSSLEELHQAILELPPPYVVKPFNGNHGNGVSLNLNNVDEVIAAFHAAKKFSHSVIIEEMCLGKDYRILVINGKMIAAAERTPPTVIGNGTHSIQELIDQLNLDPRRSEGHSDVMTKVEVDEIMLCCLKKQDLNLSSVPKQKQVVLLRQNANLSSGGTAIDITEQVHPEIKDLCERAARAVGLDICGIDLIHPDITQANQKAKIIEVNAGPGLRMHLAPSSGKAQPVAEAIIDMLYPTPEAARIPLVSVTGTNGKTTVTRMLHKVFSQKNGTCVGMTTTDGIWIGSQKVYAGDMTGPRSCQAVLNDPKVDAAVLEVARGGLLRGGLSYDWSDVSVITNIHPDHIGQDGIEDLDDLLWIKSLVAERVRPNGTVVLNADDENVLKIKDSPQIKKKPRSIFLFSKSPHNPALREHLSQGHSACWIEDGFACIQHQNLKGRLFKITDVPATLNGLADFQILNTLATLCAATAANIPMAQIIQGLQSFIPAYENIGRMNIYKIKNNYIVLDYGHNQEAIQSVGNLIAKIPGYKKTTVASLPGDRSDELLVKTARSMALIFDKIILKEDKDLRGRRPGELPQLLNNAITRLNPVSQQEIILDEAEAIEKAIAHSRSNEIIAVFYEKLDVALKVLHTYDAEPVGHIPSIILPVVDKPSLIPTPQHQIELIYSIYGR